MEFSTSPSDPGFGLARPLIFFASPIQDGIFQQTLIDFGFGKRANARDLLFARKHYMRLDSAPQLIRQPADVSNPDTSLPAPL